MRTTRAGATAHDIPATEAAVRLGLSRERVIRLIQTGQLNGRRDSLAGWRVSERAVNQLIERVNARRIR